MVDDGPVPSLKDYQQLRSALNAIIGLETIEEQKERRKVLDALPILSNNAKLELQGIDALLETWEF
jgi:hypothetical protein